MVVRLQHKHQAVHRPTGQGIAAGLQLGKAYAHHGAGCVATGHATLARCNSHVGCVPCLANTMAMSEGVTTMHAMHGTHALQFAIRKGDHHWQSMLTILGSIAKRLLSLPANSNSAVGCTNMELPIAVPHPSSMTGAPVHAKPPRGESSKSGKHAGQPDLQVHAAAGCPYCSAVMHALIACFSSRPACCTGHRGSCRTSNPRGPSPCKGPARRSR